jgi:hypothetical protein
MSYTCVLFEFYRRANDSSFEISIKQMIRWLLQKSFEKKKWTISSLNSPVSLLFELKLLELK